MLYTIYKEIFTRRKFSPMHVFGEIFFSKFFHMRCIYRSTDYLLEGTSYCWQIVCHNAKWRNIFLANILYTVFGPNNFYIIIIIIIIYACTSVNTQAKLLGLNAMKLLGLEVAKYKSSDEEELPQAKRFKPNTDASQQVV